MKRLDSLLTLFTFTSRAAVLPIIFGSRENSRFSRCPNRTLAPSSPPPRSQPSRADGHFRGARVKLAKSTSTPKSEFLKRTPTLTMTRNSLGISCVLFLSLSSENQSAAQSLANRSFDLVFEGDDPISDF
jgi:hypothetical protein